MTISYLRFWGVRGSVATPGLQTAMIGGNTSCVEVQLGGQRFILDGGTGLHQLGSHLGSQPLSATMLFSHLHWDHIQGVPFFGPLWNPLSQLKLFGPKFLPDALTAQMKAPTFPIGIDAMAAGREFVAVSAGDVFSVSGVNVATYALNHPGGSMAYRLQFGGISVVYASDTESPESGVDQELAAFCEGADILIHDAQYLPEEFPAKRGWGHSSYVHAAELARAARVRRLVLTHHDPQRTDEQVLGIEECARKIYDRTLVAREGLILMLSPPTKRDQLADVVDASVEHLG